MRAPPIVQIEVGLRVPLIRVRAGVRHGAPFTEVRRSGGTSGRVRVERVSLRRSRRQHGRIGSRTSRSGPPRRPAPPPVRAIVRHGQEDSKKTTTEPSAIPPSRAFAAPGGTVDVTTVSTDATPIGPQSKAEAEAAMAGARDQAGRPAGAAVRPEHRRGSAPGAAGAAGHGHLRQGRGGQPRCRHGRSGRHLDWRRSRSRPRRSSPTTSSGGSRSRCRQPGFIGVFNRSQYEDVLVVRVHNLVPEPVWCERYAARSTRSRSGWPTAHVTIVKCFLHISKATQPERLLARLEDPTKYWKYNPGDVDERGYWDFYQQAYSAALSECNTDPGAVARHPVGSEVVPELGDRCAAAADPGDDRPGLPTGARSTSRPRSAGSWKADRATARRRERRATSRRGSRCRAPRDPR